MNVIVNSNRREIADNACLTDLLKELELQNKSGIAIAINQQVVPKKQWPSNLLREGDQVVIIKATQGG